MTYDHKFFSIAFAIICFNVSSTNYLLLAEQEDRQQELRVLRRVVDVLNSTAEEANKWDDMLVTARTQAQIADLIWDVNPQNALNYLKAAWTAAGKVEEPKRKRSAIVNRSLRNTVKRDVLLVARKRVPELAASWLEEMVEEKNSAGKTQRGTFDDRSARSAVLLQMANEVVAENPQAAADLAIDSLRDGISFNFQTTLLRIQYKNPALAETVFRAALARLRSMGMEDPNELLVLYSYLYTPGRVFGTNSSDSRNRVQLAIGGPRILVPPARQNPAMALEFLNLSSDLLASAALPQTDNAQVAARSLVSVIGVMLRVVTEQLPAKAALLRARAQQLDSEARFSNEPIPRRPDIPDIRPGESKESFTERRVDMLEEAAAKGRDVLTRDIGYGIAAMATTVLQYERGLQLAGKIDDKNLREGVRSWLIYRAVMDFIAAGDFDAAERLNLKNDDAIPRAICYVVGAQKLIGHKDIPRAREWLRQAGTIVKSTEPGEDLTHVTLGIVSTYGRFDTQAALEWLLYAVKLMRTSPPASLSNDKAPALKRINGITPIIDLGSGTTGFSLHAAVAVFPLDQFEQVLDILNEITPREARGMAVLTLSSSFLKATPKALKKLVAN